MAGEKIDESREEKLKRVNNLRWGVDRDLTSQDHWIVGVLVFFLFCVFLFFNEQSEFSGPKDQFPVFYFGGVVGYFILGLVLIMAFHGKVFGNRRLRTKSGLAERLKEVEEIDIDDDDYKTILENI